MIDTVVLSVPYSTQTVRLERLNEFYPNLKYFLKKNHEIKDYYRFHSYRNPTNEELFSGTYYPRVRLYSMPKYNDVVAEKSVCFKIEFSAPKLLYRQNFDELTEADFPNLIRVLRKRLSEMGIHFVDTDILASSQVSAIHYSKNFVLPKHSLCSSFLDELYKSKFRQTFQHNRSDYKNRGQLIRFYQKEFEIVLYDKVAELRNAKRSFSLSEEKDSHTMLPFFKELSSGDLRSVLRCEIRFKDRNRISKELKKLKRTDLRKDFKSLFNTDFSMMVLKHYWGKMVNELNYASFSMDDPRKILLELDRLCPEKNFSWKMKMLGSAMLINSEGRGPPSPLLEHIGASKPVLYKHKKDAELFSKFDTSYTLKSIKKLTKQLEEYSPLKLADFDIKFNHQNNESNNNDTCLLPGTVR